MTRRDLLRNSAMAPAAFLPQAARRTSRPNILLLMADQWRADCLGAAGNRAIHTPNLDQLAAGGVRFTNAYSSTPTCTPARAALLTGLAPWNHGMLRYAEVGSRYPLEMPRALRDAGYYTAAIGKLHYHPQRNLHGYHQALLDESGRIESTDFRSDYRSWFWSQAPNLDPDATGLGWNDFDAQALCAAGAPASHRVDRPDGRGVDRQLSAARAIFPEGVLRAPAQSLRPTGAFVAPLPGCRSAGRHGGALGQALCAAERSAERRLAWRSGSGTGAPFAPGILRLRDVRGRADRPHHRGADAARADGGDAHHLFLRPRRHDGRSPSVAQVVRRMRVRRGCP